MMDGRVAAIRAALDTEGFQDVSIMSYTAKYVLTSCNRLLRLVFCKAPLRLLSISSTLLFGIFYFLIIFSKEIID